MGKRKTIYFPFAGVVGIVVIIGLFRFVTFENTAIKTVPPAPGEVQVFLPQTPTPGATATTAPTAAPTTEGAAPAALTWNTGIGKLFADKCKACHGTMGGLALDTYANAMKGGATGPVIIPGDPNNSSLVVIQQSGAHPGLFDAAELNKVIEWIKAGAPE